ncbi:MAG: hypothetical protein ACK4KT_07235 [Thermaurantimonas sp.]
MKTKILSISLMTVLLSLVITSCEKEKKDENPNQQQNMTPTPAPPDAEGVLVNVKLLNTQSTPVGDIEIEFGGAAAYFPDASGKFLDAGEIMIDQKYKLKKQTGAMENYYFYEQSSSDLTGIEYGSQIKWSVSGSSAVQAFDYTISGSMPTVGKITTTGSLSKSGCSISVSSVTGADSVMFMIGGKIKYRPGNATTCQFTADDMKDVGTGPQLVQVLPFKMIKVPINNKKYYFVREVSRSMMMDVVN